MIDEQADRPAAPAPKPDLEEMSLEALHAYIGDLREEIGRAEAAIERRRRHLGRAAELFRS